MAVFASRRITFLATVVFGFGLFMLDHSTALLEPLRRQLGDLLLPLSKTAYLPRLTQSQGEFFFKSKQVLAQEIAYLQMQTAAQSLKLQGYAKLVAENQRLRDALSLQTTIDQPVVVAEVLMVQISSLAHKVLINKGAVEGIMANSIVFDAHGIVGQVHSVRQQHSWVTLISDPDHSIPIQLPSTNVRGVLRGVGDLDRLELSYIPATASVAVDDLVVTSGLGGRFLPDFPLASVTSMDIAPQQAFASIAAKPRAELDQLRFLFVLQPADGVRYSEYLDEE